LLLAVAVLVAGCEDTDVAREDSSTVTFSVSDYRYAPQNLSVPDGPLRLVLRNEGVEATSLVIRRGARERGRISTVGPGETGAVTVRLAPGEYEIGSATGKHEVLGQYGRLIVR
jgi:hypothetical protein